MNDKLYCLLNPVSPQPGETYEENIRLGMAWCGLLLRAGIPIIAPQFLLLRSLDDKDPEQRKLGMKIMADAMLRCDGIVSVGARYSNGMRGEIEAALEKGLEWHDLVGFRSPCDWMCNTMEAIKSEDCRSWASALAVKYNVWTDDTFLSARLMLPCRDESSCAVERVKQGWAT